MLRRTAAFLRWSVASQKPIDKEFPTRRNAPEIRSNSKAGTVRNWFDSVARRQSQTVSVPAERHRRKYGTSAEPVVVALVAISPSPFGDVVGALPARNDKSGAAAETALRYSRYSLPAENTRKILKNADQKRTLSEGYRFFPTRARAFLRIRRIRSIVCNRSAGGCIPLLPKANLAHLLGDSFRPCLFSVV